MQDALVFLFGVPLYFSGFFFWPACAWSLRKSGCRTRALRWVFLSQLSLLLVLIGLFVFSKGLLEHQYYWLGFMVLLNVLFTPLAIGAMIFDYRAGNQGT